MGKSTDGMDINVSESNLVKYFDWLKKKNIIIFIIF